jgi:hypothetical protein
MADLLRILFLEDDAADAELIQWQLSNHGLLSKLLLMKMSLCKS